KKGWDTTLGFMASKQVIGGEMPGAVHFNAAWTHNFDDQPEERDDLYRFALGYNQSLTPETTVIVDFAREQHVTDDELENVVEAGIRQNIDEKTVLNIGGGFGFGDDSPDFRL